MISREEACEPAKVGDWFAVAPRGVAAQQVAWERAQRLIRMRAAGMAYAEIARREGVSRSRVSQITGEGAGVSPLRRWLASSGDIAALAAGGFRGWTGRGL